MKLKLNFDKNATKNFLLEHVEKFVFAGMMFLFLALLSGAIWANRYDREPNDLQQSAERANRDIDDRSKDPDRNALDYAEMILGNRPPRENDYRLPVSWNPPLVNPMALRDEPPVLLVRELRGSAGYGAFNVRQTREAGEDDRRRGAREVVQVVRGQRWAVVTGLIPLRDQEQAYEEFFRERIKPTPEPDLPEYIYYRVERAEVDPYSSPSDPERLKWTHMNLGEALANAEKLWTGPAPEVVDERFLHPRLVFPLGPRVPEQRARGLDPLIGGMHAGEDSLSPWGEEVAHLPEIPLKRHRLEDDMMEDEGPGAPAPGGRDDPDFDLPLGGEEGRGYPRTMPGGHRPIPSRLREAEGMRRGMPGRMDAYAGEGMSMQDEAPEHLLFRFFDYSVQPGKAYRYRVRLVLANPNYGLDRKFLVRPELAATKWFEKERWSDPTPPITIPRDAHVLAGGVHPLIRPTDDPSGTVAIVKWQESTGEEVHKDFRITRGQLLDYPDVVVRDRTRIRREAAADVRPAAGGLLGLGARDPRDEEPEKVDFVTGILALDLVGGTRLPGRDRLTEPGRILVMDFDGTLRMLSEVHDRREFERRTSEPESPDETDMPGMMYEEGMMDDMMLLEGGVQPRGRRPTRTPMGSP